MNCANLINFCLRITRFFIIYSAIYSKLFLSFGKILFNKNLFCLFSRDSIWFFYSSFAAGCCFHWNKKIVFSRKLVSEKQWHNEIDLVSILRVCVCECVFACISYSDWRFFSFFLYFTQLVYNEIFVHHNENTMCNCETRTSQNGQQQKQKNSKIRMQCTRIFKTFLLLFILFFYLLHNREPELLRLTSRAFFIFIAFWKCWIFYCVLWITVSLFCWMKIAMFYYFLFRRNTHTHTHSYKKTKIIL